MKFSIGDLVSIKKTGEEGKITAIIDDEMYQIEINGTTFPAYKDEIEHPYLNWFLKQKKSNNTVQEILVDTKSSDKQKKGKDLFSIGSGYHLEFQPTFMYDGFDDVVTEIKVYIVNQSPEQAQLKYVCKGKVHPLMDTLINTDAYSKTFLHTIPYELMHQQPTFEWCIIRTSKGIKHEFKDVLSIKPKKLYDIIHQIQLDEHPKFSIQLCSYATIDEDETSNWDATTDENLQNLNFAVEPIPENVQHSNKQNNEIDLHIERLVDDTTDLDSFEILQIQLDAFEQALNNAIQQKLSHFTIIHGVGKGKLRDAIHNILRTKYNIFDYIQDWSPTYGNGATQIIFKHN